MTPAQARELLPVFTAYAEGRVVQWRVHQAEGYWDRWLTGLWRDYNPAKNGQPYQPCFDDSRIKWRIKPTPWRGCRCPQCGKVWDNPLRDPALACRCSVTPMVVEEVVGVKWCC